MPAKSKSQQRLFGMVHAYNKGELQCSPALRKRIAAIAAGISDEDARHFAETSHKGLPNVKEAQEAVPFKLSPQEMRIIVSKSPMLYSALTQIVAPQDEQPERPMRSARRRSILAQAFRGGLLGSLIGGAGMGSLGALAVYSAAPGSSKMTPDERRRSIIAAGLRSGIHGAGYGGAIGTAGGLGIGLVNRLRS